MLGTEELKKINPIKLPKYSINKNPNCGVYFLFNNGRVVYVGQSKDVPVRIFQHKTQKEKTFDQYAFIKCNNENLDELEEWFIIKYGPKYNVKIPVTSFCKRQDKSSKSQKQKKARKRNLLPVKYM